MAVDELELMCHEYIWLLKDIESFPKGLYGLDQLRTKLHDRICKLSGKTKEETKKITDNMDKHTTGTELYLAILEL
jgi:Cu/Ag efflux pump CusA